MNSSLNRNGFPQNLSSQNAQKLAKSLVAAKELEDFSVVISSSMSPLLTPGDLLQYFPVSGRLRSGDVGEFKRGTHQVIHRVLFVRNGIVQTKGDASKGWDTPFPLDDVVGVVPELHSKQKVFISIIRGWYLRFRAFGGSILRRLHLR